MVSAISFGWFADFGKSLTINQCSFQPVPSVKWLAPQDSWNFDLKNTKINCFFLAKNHNTPFFSSDILPPHPHGSFRRIFVVLTRRRRWVKFMRMNNDHSISFVVDIFHEPYEDKQTAKLLHSVDKKQLLIGKRVLNSTSLKREKNATNRLIFI